MTNLHTYTQTDGELKIDIPEFSKWRCYLFGSGSTLVLTPTKGNEPNWFWRWMQYLLIGNKWVKGK